MKHIGIFGDSFAARAFNSPAESNTWYEILKNKHGFDVTTYGKNGASNEYIFNQFFNNHFKYDYVIYIKTSYGRFSLPPHISMSAENNFLRFNMPTLVEQHLQYSKKYSDKIVTKSLEVLNDYYSYLFDEDTAKHTTNALTLYAKSIRPKQSLFLSVVDNDEISLMDVSKKELDYAGIDLEDMRKYSDGRNCHLSERNNEILADKIANWVNTSEFELNVDHFEYNANLDKSKLFYRYDNN